VKNFQKKIHDPSKEMQLHKVPWIIFHAFITINNIFFWVQTINNLYLFFCFHFRPINGGRLIRLVCRDMRTDQMLFQWEGAPSKDLPDEYQ